MHPQQSVEEGANFTNGCPN